MSKDSILDFYFKNAPSPQNALDIFKDEWSSQLPSEYSQFRAGSIPLFEDSRVAWTISEIGGIENKKVLELGPLEGGNTYMLEKAGAHSILSIEANSKAYMKCLIIKELLELKRTKFLCGNFMEFFKTNYEKFDFCLASGVLYHMENPVELLYYLSQTTDIVSMWTHYYDKELVSNNQNLNDKYFEPMKKTEFGFTHTLYKQEYKMALDLSGFCGGLNPFSNWMTRNDIISCLERFGFHKIKINFDDITHPHGPGFLILAQK
jgi:hypothetical protein